MFRDMVQSCQTPESLMLELAHYSDGPMSNPLTQCGDPCGGCLSLFSSVSSSRSLCAVLPCQYKVNWRQVREGTDADQVGSEEGIAIFGF